MHKITNPRYVLFILTLLYATHQMDRYLVGVMLQPIKEDLLLNDSQLGFLTGIAFAFFYATLGIPIARLADRGNRVNIASVSIALWGGMVILSGFVTNFIQFAVARIGTSIGEAGCMPPSYSLIGDYFTGSSHTRAMSTYMVGGVGSAMIGFALGGWLNDAYGWRAAFVIAGVPGIALGLLIKFTVVEPRQTQRHSPLQDSHVQPSLRNVCAMLWKQSAFRYLIIGLGLFYMVGWGFPVWMGAFLERTYHMTSSEVGLSLGLIFGCSGGAGVLLGGYLSSRYLQNKEALQMAILGLTSLATIPLTLAFTLASNKYACFAAMIILAFVFNLTAGPVFALIQRLVRSEMRATSLSLVMLIANFVGLGLGPQVVGVLSDVLMPVFAEQSLGMAMVVASIVLVPASYCFWRVGKTVEQDLCAVNQSKNVVANVVPIISAPIANIK